MEPGSVSYLPPTTERVFTHDGMASVRIIRIQGKNLWGVIRDGQRTNRVSRGNINDIWKLIRDILGSFVWAGTITNGHGREVQRWNKTFKWKGIIEAIINCPAIL